MRWFWIDRFTEFVCGEFATATKNVSFSEPHVHDYVPSWPVMPASLIVEGLAQTGGLLLGQQHDFRKKVVLAKLTKANFDRFCVPGETIHYRTDIEMLTEEGGIVKGTCTVNEEEIVSADIVFAYLGDQFKNVELFTDAELMKMLRSLRLFEVGVNPDGTPIEIPQHLLDGEKAGSVEFAEQARSKSGTS